MDAKIDRTVIKVAAIDDAGNDYAYWQGRSHEDRLRTLESIRREYHAWRNDSEPGFQRVCRVIEQE
jgi:hypothetical protein